MWQHLPIKCYPKHCVLEGSQASPPSVLLVTASCTFIRAWNTVRMILTGQNRRSRRKTCPSVTSSATNVTWTGLKTHPCLRGDRPLLIWIIHTNSVPASRKILAVPVTKAYPISTRNWGIPWGHTTHTETHPAVTVQTC
jgi:hypothetical protein